MIYDITDKPFANFLVMPIVPVVVSEIIHSYIDEMLVFERLQAEFREWNRRQADMERRNRRWQEMGCPMINVGTESEPELEADM